MPYLKILVKIMKKGARQKPSKERKHIEIKQSRQISPIKQLVEGEESHVSYPLEKSQKIAIPHLKKSGQEFTSQQIQNLSKNADAIISVQIMRASIKKEQIGIEEFYRNCPAIVQKVFKKALGNMEASLNLIRQERIQRMKDDTLIFVPPDKDHFQKQKGQTLNNWIKQTIQHHSQKQTFEKQSQTFTPIYQQTSSRISKLSEQLPNTEIDHQFEKMSLKTNQNNETLLNNKKIELTNQLRNLLEAANNMRRLKEQEIQRRKTQEFRKQRERKLYVREKVGSVTMGLYGIEDYFY